MNIQGKHIILFILLLILTYINYSCYLVCLEYSSLQEFFNDSMCGLLIILESIFLFIAIIVIIVNIIIKYWNKNIHINFKLRKR